MKRSVRFLVLLTLVSLQPSIPGTATTSRAEAQQSLASRAVDLLERRDTSALAALLHYPPTAQTERAKDIAAVEKMLQFLLSRFGAPSEVKPWRGGAVSFFEVGVSAGTIEYWQSLSPFETIDNVYSAKFERFGFGIVKIEAFKHAAMTTPQVRTVAFGLLTSRSDAKSLIIQATRDMMAVMEVPLPPNIVELLDQQLRPVDYRPPEE